MAQITETSDFDLAAFDRGLDPLLKILTPDQARSFVLYRGDEALQDRVEELAAKCNEGELTPAERAEYEGYVRANKFVSILQARVRQLFKRAAD